MTRRMKKGGKIIIIPKRGQDEKDAKKKGKRSQSSRRIKLQESLKSHATLQNNNKK